MVTKEVAEACGTALNKLTATGTSVLVEGELTATPEGVKQVWTGGRRRGKEGRREGAGWGSSVLVEGELAATPEGVKQVWTGGGKGLGERHAG